MEKKVEGKMQSCHRLLQELTRQSTLVLILFSAFLCGIFLFGTLAARASPDNENIDTQPLRPIDQQSLNAMARTLQVKYEVLNNHPSDKCHGDKESTPCFAAKISLSTKQAVNAQGWELYFSHISPIQSAQNEQFSIAHINGDLHRLTPTSAFTGFAPGEKKEIFIWADFWHLSETDPMPNYYLAAKHLQARVIRSTQTTIDRESGLELRPYVKTFTDGDKQFLRSAKEKTQWATSSNLFTTNKKLFAERHIVNTADIDSAIVPKPTKITLSPNGGRIDLAKGVLVTTANIERKDIDAALQRLASLNIHESDKGARLHLSLKTDKNTPTGAYTLSINSTAIRIVAADAQGAANGLQSLAGLVQLGKSTLPVLTIEDRPRYPFRGLHLDVARNFHSKALVIKLLDQMAAYKLNKLHLHLADDEGWRLEIPGLPELTTVASKRCHDLAETRCLLPQLGSGPNPDTAVNGYYSVQDYHEILRAASARHIQVIPSLDMPGHARAAIKAMLARYQKFMRAEQQHKAQQYLLHDLQDTTAYRSVQFYNDNTINVCMESAYAFIEKVIDEVKNIHAQAQHPLTRYHIGADETAGAWTESPACKAFLNRNRQGITQVKQLGKYFIERVAGILAARDIEPAGWSDGISQADKKNLPAIVQANAWGTLHWQGHKIAHDLADRSWQVVISTPDATYFDFPYEADPKERGNYWASRHTNSRKVFEFMPDNLPAHAEIWQDEEGNEMHLDDSLVDSDKAIKHLSPQQDRHFHGLQAHLWSEMVRTDKQVEYMLFPRLLALAERAWHKAEWELPYNYQGAVYNKNSGFFTPSMRAQRDRDWIRFANILGLKELLKLDNAGIHYRIPTVGAAIIDGKLNANTIFPGLPISYRIDNGNWMAYTGRVTLDKQGKNKVAVRALSADGKRKGRILVVQ